MPSDERLEPYRSKRNLGASGEPSGGRGHEQPRFVVQRHAASTLHFDFRLEAAGVLKSWAVPKGPTLDPEDRRLATRTEDHPVDYADFEGEIPEGEYGAGTVVVWDAGPYRNLTERDGSPIPVAEAVDNGHVKVWLDGHKLRGAFALTRMRSQDWLLIKLDDEGADRRRKPARTQPESVLSGETNEDMEEDDR